MSTSDKNNKPWSGSDIEKYLKGQLSAREMYDLEQAALEDPFLGDALEGIAMNDRMLAQEPGGSGLDQDLAALRDRLAARALTKNDQPLYYVDPAPAGNPDPAGTSAGNAPPADATGGKARYRSLTRRLSAAAVLILLLGLGLAAFLTFRTSPRSSIAAVKKEQSAPQTAVSANTAPATAQSRSDSAASKPVSQSVVATLAHTTTASEHAPQTTAGKSNDSAAASPPVNSATASQPAAQTAASLHPDADKRVDANFNYLSPAVGHFDTTNLRNRQGSFKYSLGNAFISRQVDNSLIFRGVVLDPQDHPLAGASLYLKGVPNTGTTTDQEGYFNLPLRPQDSSRQLMVALVGYKEKAFALNILNTDGPGGNVIRLQPHPEGFNEVVVSGYGTQRKETLAEAPSSSEERLDSLWQFATPVIGGSAYRRYLDSARNTLGLDSSIRGTEAISFEVGRNGGLTSFKIEQSMSPAHDSGLIRLVNEGAAWKLLKGKKARVIVSVNF